MANEPPGTSSHLNIPSVASMDLLLSLSWLGFWFCFQTKSPYISLAGLELYENQASLELTCNSPTTGSSLFFKVDIGVPNSSSHAWSASAFFIHPKPSPQPTPLSVCIVEYPFEHDMATGILKSEQLYLPSQDQSDNLGEARNVRLT